MSRTRFGALVAATMLVVAACGGSTATTAPSAAESAAPTSAASQAASAAAASPAASIKEGGTLVVGLNGDMVLADPSLISDSNSSYVMNNVVQGLVGLKPGTISDVIPVLAASMPTVSADGLTYTFTLRQGIKFHDGTDFNADAVVYNYMRQLNAPTALQNDYNYYFGAVFNGFGADSNLASVTAPDESTVVFKLKTPQSNFLLATSIVNFGIQSPTALKAGDADNPDPSKSPYAQGQGGTGKSMVGTGPFMFKEWVPNDHITLVKNPNYWDPAGAAHLDAITFRPLADPTATLNALQAGDIDFAQTISPNDVATVKGDSSLQVIDRGASCNELHLSLNNAMKPFDNLQIRQAIGYALNKQPYIDAFYAGLANIADNFMPPSTEYYKPLNLPTYDPQKAKDLIASSGVPASELNLTFYYPSDVVRPYMPDPKGIAEAIATDLEAVGFNITFQTEGWRTGYLTDVNAGKLPMYLLGWTCDWAGPDNFLVTDLFYFDGNKPNPQFSYGPADLKAAFDAGIAATTDAAAQTAWDQAQDILARDLPIIPILNSKPPAAATAAMKGFVGAGNLTESFNTVWLDR